MAVTQFIFNAGYMACSSCFVEDKRCYIDNLSVFVQYFAGFDVGSLLYTTEFVWLTDGPDFQSFILKLGKL